MHRLTVFLVLLTVVLSGPVGAVAQDASPIASPSAGVEIDGTFDVGGGRLLYLHCLGSGSPTVVLEGGFTADTTTWQLVFDEIGAFTRVCAYDRAGLGLSDPPATEEPRSFQETVDDLHALLSVAAEPGPYVLVAHSLGGMLIRLFASQYPDEVVGMVFVDTSAPGYFGGMIERIPNEVRRERERNAMGGQNEEFLDILGGEIITAETDPQDPPVPCIALVHLESATDYPPSWPGEQLAQLWTDTQQTQAARYGCPLTIVEEAGHQIQLDEPQVVIVAVRRVVEAVRNPTSWSTPTP